MSETVAEKIDVNHILKLVKTESNDYVLGEKVRLYIYDLEKTR